MFSSDVELVDRVLCKFEQVFDGLGVVPKALPITRRDANALADVSPSQAVQQRHQSSVQLGSVPVSWSHD
jgi:hypothetical protein